MPVDTEYLPVPSRFSDAIIFVSLVLRSTLAFRITFSFYLQILVLCSRWERKPEGPLADFNLSRSETPKTSKKHSNNFNKLYGFFANPINLLGDI
jgi:hypothetical protein